LERREERRGEERRGEERRGEERRGEERRGEERRGEERKKTRNQIKCPGKGSHKSNVQVTFYSRGLGINIPRLSVAFGKNMNFIFA
jgi:hypothetical protein